MKRSEHRILTTHVGSLPRPPALRDLLVRQDRGEVVDAAALAREAEAAVRHVVRKQLEAGIDVGNDGEQPRRPWASGRASWPASTAASAPSPARSSSKRALCGPSSAAFATARTSPRRVCGGEGVISYAAPFHIIGGRP